MFRSLTLATIVASLLMLVPSTKAQAYTRSITGTTMEFGDISFHRFSDGLTGSTTRVGDSSFSSFSNGLRVSSFSLGDMESYSLSNGVTGYSTQLGDVRTYSFSNGLHGTATDSTPTGLSSFNPYRCRMSGPIGDTTTYQFNNGFTGRTLHMGDIHFHNLSVPVVPSRNPYTHLYDGIFDS